MGAGALNEISVTISSDRMSARVRLPPDLDARQLDRTVLAGIVRDAGVEVTPDVEARVAGMLEQLAQGDPEPGGVVAVGTAAVPGRDGSIEWCPGFDPDEVITLERGDDDEVDHYARTRVRTVRNGDLIGRLTAPDPGIDGRDVTGGTVPARPGRPAPLRMGDGVQVDEAGAVRALCDGVLDRVHGVLCVSPVLDIAGCVDFSTGNIDFPGQINIRGDVRDRFVVRATGSVHVDGLVEGATMLVGGSFTLRCGMAAKERGQVVVDGDCEAGFLNNVRGRVGGSLAVRNELIDCHLVVGGNLAAPAASVVGGTLAVTGEVIVSTLGSIGGSPTELILEGAPLLIARLARTEDVVERGREALAALRDELAQRVRSGCGQSVRNRERITELSALIAERERRIDVAATRVEDLRREIRAVRRLRLTIGRMLHARVRLRVRGAVFEVQQDVRGPFTVERSGSGAVVLRRPDGSAQLLSEVVPVGGRRVA
ncbi:MAG: DUF342 domain-containing protein [Phycisphaeraceae bacterium]|nr:DUF342 domain-containing protein [Phycisphaeraceae bacterium]